MNKRQLGVLQYLSISHVFIFHLLYALSHLVMPFSERDMFFIIILITM